MSGWKDWQPGEVVNEDDFQSLIQDQVVQVYESNTDRNNILGLNAKAGMVSYIKNVDETQVYNGTNWVAFAAGDITAVTAGTALTGGGTSGDVTLDVDISALATAHAGNALTANGDLLDVDESAINIDPNQVNGTAVITTDSRLSDARTPTAHATSHESGGTDEIEIAPAQVTGTAVIDSDSRLTDARNPTTHASTHESGGSDEIEIAQSQVTDLTTELAGKQDDVITTQGDLVIGDANGDAIRLPVGTANQVLTSDGTTVSFQDAQGGDTTGGFSNVFMMMGA